MKIVHIAPNAPYNENWGYQDNLLPKYHKKLGHEVTLIVTNTMHKDGKIVETDCCDKMLDDGVRLIRLKKKKYIHRVLTNLNARLDCFDILKELRPDFVFFHGVISTTIYDVIRYKKKVNAKCKIVCDNHLDENNNSLMGKGIRKPLFSCFHWRHNKKALKYVEKFYGVTPWRKAYLEKFFKIPPEKTDVLIMGADNEQLDFQHRKEIRASIREQYNIEKQDFLILTGGKIDKQKNITLLMKACAQMENIKLLVFGNVQEDIKIEFEKILSEASNICYIGWVAADKVYDYFFAADLVVFPGGHSVMWEQACASKVPCVFKYWEGMDHVNNGGNSEFLNTITEASIRIKIKELQFTEKYKKMKAVAESEKTNIYLYSEIAKKSLEAME